MARSSSSKAVARQSKPAAVKITKESPPKSPMLSKAAAALTKGSASKTATRSLTARLMSEAAARAKAAPKKVTHERPPEPKAVSKAAGALKLGIAGKSTTQTAAGRVLSEAAAEKKATRNKSRGKK
ncbi:MAG: hypothetical protein WBX25_03715 [Rhodomicrobium sp.]